MSFADSIGLWSLSKKITVPGRYWLFKLCNATHKLLQWTTFSENTDKSCNKTSISVQWHFFRTLFKGKKKEFSVFHDQLDKSSREDKKPINFISNFQDPTVVTEVGRRQKDGTLLQIACLEIVKSYNQYKGGCNKNDQLIRLLGCRKHYKWPRR